MEHETIFYGLPFGKFFAGPVYSAVTSDRRSKGGTMAAADTLLVPEQWTYDGRFRDMSGLRCADAVKTSFDTGLLEGRQADRFDAVSELTNAQILVISARLYDRLTGGSGLAAPAVGEAWYQSALTLLSGLSTDTAQSAMSRSVLQIQ